MSKNAETKKHVLDISKASLSHLCTVQSSQTGHLTLCIRALHLKPASSVYTRCVRFHHQSCPCGTAKAKQGPAHPAAARCLIQLGAAPSPALLSTGTRRDRFGRMTEKHTKKCSICSPRMSKLRLWLGVHLCQLSGAAAALCTSPAASRARSPNLLFLPHHCSSPRASYWGSI